jgi:hypothetical protein
MTFYFVDSGESILNYEYHYEYLLKFETKIEIVLSNVCRGPMSKLIHTKNLKIGLS